MNTSGSFEAPNRTGFADLLQYSGYQTMPCDTQRGQNQFRALTWLEMLKELVDSDRLVASCVGTPRYRAGAVRVVYESVHPNVDARLVSSQELYLENRS